jgi:hypothetical protein
MAKFTPLYGNISGKLGANVFAHGKGGAYIRTFKPPTNANSAAQQAARVNFSNASRAWSALTSAQKGSWNQFAATLFSPKKPKSGVTYSGASAYSSCAAQIAASQRAAVTNVTDLTPVTPETLEFGNWMISAGPSDSLFTGSIVNQPATQEASLELTDAAWDLSSGLTLKFDTVNSGVPTSGWTSFAFQGLTNTDAWGIAVYATRRAGGQGNSLGQVQPLLIAATKPIQYNLSFTEGTPATGFGLVLPTSAVITDSKYPFGLGDLVDLTVYAVSAKGISKLIGTLPTTIVS